jgi:G3E family GTPase
MRRYRDLLQVALVDAKRWQRRGHNNELERMQVRPASHVLFTWLDAVDAARQASVREGVARLNPRARIVVAETLAAELVRRVEGEHSGLPAGFTPWFPAPGRTDFQILPTKRPSGNHAAPGLLPPWKADGCASGEACSAHELAHRFTALQLEVPRNLPRERLTRWLESLPDSVIRAKGLVKFAGEPERYHFFQRVEESLSFTELPIIPPDGLTLALLVGIGLDPAALRREAEEHLVG